MMDAVRETRVATAQQLPPAPFTHHASAIVLHHGEKILAEIPRAIRRVALLMLVLSISIPVFLVGLLIVLWRLG
jgi:hypothetical protein